MIAQEEMQSESSTVHSLAAGFLDIFPTLDPTAQRVAIQTYRELAKGEAASVETIATAAGVKAAMARELLESWAGVFWEDGKVIGFWGLSPRPVSKHLLHVDGRTLYAWCAWDTLFLPEVLGKTAGVESTVQGSDDAITMSVSPSGVSGINPSTAVMSMLQPREDMMSDVVASLCHFIYFFPSESEGKAWVASHPDALLMTVEEGFRLGQLKNRGQFADVL